jgi:YVTN family beta-propeller protein
MTGRVRAFAGAGVAGLACLVFLGLASYRHVRYYTGDTPRTYSCYSCHVDGNGGSLLEWVERPTYLSPLMLEVSPDGRRLYATAQDGDAVIEVDLAARTVTRSITVGHRPRDLVITGDGRTAYVSNEWGNSISVVDLDAGRVTRTIPCGNMPSGLSLSRDERTLFVGDWQGDLIQAIDLSSGRVRVDLAGGGSPNELALTPDGSLLLTTNELSYVSSHRGPPRTEVTFVDATTDRPTRRVVFNNAHLIEGVTILPEGDLALVTLVKPKNLLPVLHVERGWTMSNGIGVIDLKSGRATQLLLDEANRFFADPFGVVSTPDGRLAFVSHSGVDQISVIDMAALRRLLRGMDDQARQQAGLRLDLSTQFVIKRIPTAANPKGMVVAPDGKRLYVAERLNDSILAIDTASLEPLYRIELQGKERETPRRRGEKLFNSGLRSFQGQFSCQSCHPRNQTDRLQYDFEPDGLGLGVVDNRSLLGIRDTAPYKWNGKNTSLFMQCGIRFSRILTRVDSFRSDELSDLVSFIRSLPDPPNPYRSPDGKLTPSQARGKLLYERTRTKDGQLIPESNRCITCHPPPLYTNRKRADVGSASPTDLVKEFDVPHLTNIYATAPYLHDGKARTLEEIWTLYNAQDTHGVTRDLTNQDLNDLVEYLKTF